MTNQSLSPWSLVAPFLEGSCLPNTVYSWPGIMVPMAFNSYSIHLMCSTRVINIFQSSWSSVPVHIGLWYYRIEFTQNLYTASYIKFKWCSFTFCFIQITFLGKDISFFIPSLCHWFRLNLLPCIFHNSSCIFWFTFNLQFSLPMSSSLCVSLSRCTVSTVMIW